MRGQRDRTDIHCTGAVRQDTHWSYPMRRGSEPARLLLALSMAAAAGASSPRPIRAQTTMNPQTVFDAGHNLGALQGDIRWEWLPLTETSFRGPTAFRYGIWAKQLLDAWNTAWTGVMVRSADVGQEGVSPMQVLQVRRNIDADLASFSCPSMNPPTVASNLFHAGLAMAHAFYLAGRDGGCGACVAELLARASANLASAARQFPGLMPIANDLTSMRLRPLQLADLQKAISDVNAVLPDAPLDCEAPSAVPPAPPPAPPPGAFSLYNTPFDANRARAMGMTITADSRGGQMRGDYSMDGRCRDRVRVAWQFSTDVSTIRAGQSLSVQYGFEATGNCQPATREYLVFEAHGFVVNRAVPPAVAVQSIGQQRLPTCGVLNVMESDPVNTWAWAGGANRPTSNRQTFTIDPRVTADRGGCAWAMLRFKLRDRRTGREVELVYHYER